MSPAVREAGVLMVFPYFIAAIFAVFVGRKSSRLPRPFKANIANTRNLMCLTFFFLRVKGGGEG